VTVPYSRATAGDGARREIIKMLRAFGCDNVGIMDDFTTDQVLLAFQHRGRAVQMAASARGWAAMWLKENPWNKSRKSNPEAYKAEALEKGRKAAVSMLRDWVKSQLTLVECGLMPFDHVFMAYALTSDGRPLHERVSEAKLLPPPN
jgi:hypothetical protein